MAHAREKRDVSNGSFASIASITDLIADIPDGSFVPILLQKFFCTGIQKFCGP